MRSFFHPTMKPTAFSPGDSSTSFADTRPRSRNSVDECYADITGLQRPLRMSYEKIAEKIKNDLGKELGFTFSIGLAPTKILAKIVSKWNKPSGLTVIPGSIAHLWLANCCFAHISHISLGFPFLLRIIRVRPF